MQVRDLHGGVGRWPNSVVLGGVRGESGGIILLSSYAARACGKITVSEEGADVGTTYAGFVRMRTHWLLVPLFRLALAPALAGLFLAAACDVDYEGIGGGLAGGSGHDGSECGADVMASEFGVAVEWAFEGAGDEVATVAMPAVADVTGDGVPDVVATLYPEGEWEGIGHMYVLDGATGSLHFRIDEPVAATAHPAIGDIDDDGEPEIIGFGPGSSSDYPERGVTGRLLAFEADGVLKWVGDTVFSGGQYAVGLADFDGDGDVEIYSGGHLTDHEGRKIFDVEEGIFGIQASTAVDLDDDDDLELIIGPLALHHDGSVYYDHVADISYGHPQVADLDDDGLPEILLTTPRGPRVIQHDGQLEASANGCEWGWMPAVIGDLDSDGYPEVAGAAHSSVCMGEAALTPEWSYHCFQEDGYAGASAFDFFDDGRAELLYRDNDYLYVLSNAGELIARLEGPSVTQMDFPLVVDADADGMAEILLVSNTGYESQEQPAIRLLGSTGRDWAPARGIWNQYTFHNTNITDDATIPTIEPPHWHENNSFRMMDVAR